MATAFEAPLALERDFRSSHKDVKRHRDANIKWARGVRSLPGHNWFADDEEEEIAVATHNRARPVPRFSETSHILFKDHSNIIKTNRHGHEHPASRHRSSMSAWEELNDGASRSIADLVDSPTRKAHKAAATSGAGSLGGKVSTIPATDAGNFLYSFDNTDSPPRGLTLDVFVRSNVRATEKLVEKEYEVLDANGDAVKGRKARRVLRKAAGSSPKTAASAAASGNKTDVLLDEEDFELI